MTSRAARALVAVAVASTLLALGAALALPARAPAWLEGRRTVGLTAGASAPDILVQQVARDAVHRVGVADARR